MSPNDQTTVDLLEPAAADDAGLAARVADLINTVYVTAKQVLWRDGATRTTASELARLIAAGEIAVARRRGQIVGSVRIHDVSADTSEFGMLVAAPDQRAPDQGVPEGVVRPLRLPARPQRQHRLRPSAPGAAARHPLRRRGAREAAPSGGRPRLKR